MFLTPFNYFEWKAEMVIQLRSKGLYRVTMGTETKPNSDVDKSKHFNIFDEAFGMLYLSISRDILGTPNEFWINIESLFWEIDEMRGHQLKNELISLNPAHYETIQDFFTKFKALVLQLKQCGIENKYEKNIFYILFKIGPYYSVFVSIFYSTKLIATNWRIHALADFMK